MRQRIDACFRWLGGTIYDRAWVFILAALVVALALTSQLPKLHIDTSNESFFHEDDPILTDYEAFQAQFGCDQTVVLALQPPEIFDRGFLGRLKQLHDELEENVPHLDDITSMVNARNTRGEADRLVVEDLLEDFPQSQADLAALKERVMSNPLYLNRLISPDGKMTGIVIEIDMTVPMAEPVDLMDGFDDSQTQAQQAALIDGPTKILISEEVVAAVRAIVAKYHCEDFPILVAGSPVVIKDIDMAMQKDMGRFLLMAVLLVGSCLFLMFRRISGVVLPLVVVVLTLFCTLGLMGFFRVPFTIPNMIMPSFLLAVGVGAAVHILALTYRRLEDSGDKRDAITYALDHSGLAVVMTSMTTAAGLVSFATTELAPTANLGIFAGAGVLISLFYTLVLLPALLAVIPLKPKAGKGSANGSVPDRLERLLDRVADISTGHAKTIIAVTLVVLVAGIFSAFQLRFSHDTLRWLPASWTSRQATEKIDDVMGGTINLEVLVDTGRENGLYDPTVLRSLNHLARELEAYDDGRIRVAKATSVTDVLKEIHQALNENRPEFYAVPDNADLIPQEFLLFENSGSDDLEKVIDSAYRTARFTVQVPWLDMFYYVPLIQDIATRFEETLGEKANVSTTGILRLFASTVAAAAHSMAEGYATSAVTITVMMILLLGSLRMGLISMIPNLAPVVLVMGMMHWLGLPLDIFTMMIGAIALGLAVDDTVHFMNGFQRYHEEEGSAKAAVRRTLHTSGRAMLVTSIVLSIGFFVYTFAFMENLVRFGFLTGLTILLALVADFFSVPALMTLIHSRSEPEQAAEAATSTHLQEIKE